MILIEWNDGKMSLGIRLIDEQHKKLVNIINKLSASIHEGSQRDTISEIIDELIDYATFHFETEERLFDKFQYEETANHKKEHALFFENFLEIRNDISNDKLYKMTQSIHLSEEIFEYTTNWLIHHILESDKKFVKLFKDNGIK